MGGSTLGLSRSERQLLQLAEPGPVDVLTAFAHMHDGEDVLYITDTSFMALVEALSRTTPPLITVAGWTRGHGPMPQGTVTLTDVGRAVLSGERDRMTTCGMDRWLGGVHTDQGHR